MTPHRQMFRLQFLGSPSERGPTILAEREILAADVEARLGVLPGTGSNASMERTPDGKCSR